MTSEDARIFALWLEPNDQDAKRCSALIEDLAQQYQSPVFDPHVTVFSGLFDDLDPLKAHVDNLAKITGPVTVNIVGFNFKPTFFRTFYLELEEHPILTRFHDQLWEDTGKHSTYDLNPHLSLLYADIPLTAKQELVNSRENQIHTVTFAHLSLITPQNPDLGWHDVSAWKRLYRVDLKGKGSLDA